MVTNESGKYEDIVGDHTKEVLFINDTIEMYKSDHLKMYKFRL